MSTKTVRTATFKDSGKVYLVRLVNTVDDTCRLWGEVVSATRSGHRGHGPDLCGVPLADVALEEVEMTVRLHNQLVQQGLALRMERAYGQPAPLTLRRALGQAPADLVALVNKAVRS